MISIWTAIENGDAVAVSRYIGEGGDPNVELAGKDTLPLIYAIDRNQKTIYSILLESGADPNKFTSPPKCISAMIVSVEQNDSYWLEQALRHRGDPNLRPSHQSNQSSPGYWAIRNGTNEAFNMLCDHGLDIDYVDKYGFSLLTHASDSGLHYDKVLLLLNRGAKYNPPVSEGKDESFSFFWYLRIHTPEKHPRSKVVADVWKWFRDRGIDPRGCY